MILSMSKSYCSHFGGHFCSISWSPLWKGSKKASKTNWILKIIILASWWSRTVQITTNNGIDTHDHVSIIAIPKQPILMLGESWEGWKLKEHYRISSQNIDSSWNPMSSSSSDKQHPHLYLLSFSSESFLVKLINLIRSISLIYYIYEE